MTGADKPAGPGGGVTFFTLAMNYLPFVYLAAGTAAILSLEGTTARVAMALAWIYLVPVLVGRVVMGLWGRPEGRGLKQEARAYKVWWVLTQIQMVLNRLPVLEEVMRLVPGLYALWLTLWGSRVSPFSFWAPGTRVMDRSLVDVGRGAVIGAKAVLSGHLGTIAADGAYVVDIAPVVVEQGAIVGARTALGPGCRVGTGEQVPAGRLLAPFTTWVQGRKTKG